MQKRSVGLYTKPQHGLQRVYLGVTYGSAFIRQNEEGKAELVQAIGNREFDGVEDANMEEIEMTLGDTMYEIMDGEIDYQDFLEMAYPVIL